MCGRYSLSSTAQLVRETFDVEESTADLVPRWNIAPTQEAPVVRLATDGRRQLGLLRWGLLPAATEPGRPGSPAINARSETAATLPAFRDSFRARRCLVPADGFYEWLKLEGSRHPFHIRRRDRKPLALAGLWGRRQGRRRDPVESFTILTCPPNELVRPLHDRMPVILPPAAWEAWLAPESPAEMVQGLLVPSVDDELEAVPVSPFVNSADHEGAECQRQVAAPARRQLSLLPP
jgi:putative SOS response-associated peptidase YedK